MTLQRIRRASLVIGIGLVVAAVATELRKPVEMRTWQGYVAGVVPYDFRLSHAVQLSSNGARPDSDRLVIPRRFGVGWTVNITELSRRLRALQRSWRAKRSRTAS